jgi:hypothetical protein
MKRLIALAVVTSWIGWAGARTTFTAPQTWVGVISDTQCGGDHGCEVDERQCTMKSVHNGLKYVLVTGFGSKVWQIANQRTAATRRKNGSSGSSGCIKAFTSAALLSFNDRPATATRSPAAPSARSRLM